MRPACPRWRAIAEQLEAVPAPVGTAPEFDVDPLALAGVALFGECEGTVPGLGTFYE